VADGRFRLPRSLREYTALDANALRAMLVDATEFGWPTSGEPDDLLRHTAADGIHLLRATRPDEILFDPHHQGLAEYRCLTEWMMAPSWRTACGYDRHPSPRSFADSRSPGICGLRAA
jgi:hypothetical protein